MIARKYLYLIALAREKHFGRAAEACHVSASTLSAAIRDIESELGVTIVERGQQFSGLTPEANVYSSAPARWPPGPKACARSLPRCRMGWPGGCAWG
jgi:hypothetical protein